MQPSSVDGAVGRKVGRHPVDAHDAACRQRDVAGLVKAEAGSIGPFWISIFMISK